MQMNYKTRKYIFIPFQEWNLQSINKVPASCQNKIYLSLELPVNKIQDESLNSLELKEFQI